MQAFPLFVCFTFSKKCFRLSWKVIASFLFLGFWDEKTPQILRTSRKKSSCQVEHTEFNRARKGSSSVDDDRWYLERCLHMMERAAGLLRRSQNGPKGELFICCFFPVPYTGKILSVSLQRWFLGFFVFCFCFFFKSSLVMVTLCLRRELQKGEHRWGVELLDGEGIRRNLGHGMECPRALIRS